MSNEQIEDVVEEVEIDEEQSTNYPENAYLKIALKKVEKYYEDEFVKFNSEDRVEIKKKTNDFIDLIHKRIKVDKQLKSIINGDKSINVDIDSIWFKKTFVLSLFIPSVLLALFDFYTYFFSAVAIVVAVVSILNWCVLFYSELMDKIEYSKTPTLELHCHLIDIEIKKMNCEEFFKRSYHDLMTYSMSFYMVSNAEEEKYAYFYEILLTSMKIRMLKMFREENFYFMNKDFHKFSTLNIRGNLDNI